MYTDANTLDNGTRIEGDICIIGAGAAGISMALEWANTSHRLILLEGGDFNVESEIQDLYRAENVGQKYFPIQSSRLHFFGGTTGHWGGLCARFDPWDFEKRDWVPNSGWPISLDDLIPYYDRAQTVVEIGPSERWDAQYWQNQDPALTLLPFDKSKVWSKMWQFSKPTQFGKRYRDDIVYSKNIHLYTHANVCDISTNEGVSAVQEVEIRCLNGKSHRVSARHFVLACGAIQNARILLASNKQASKGLGNDHDLVGRYFMEHLEAPAASFIMAAPGPLSLYMMSSKSYSERRSRAELVLSYEQQKKHQILNCSADISAGFRAVGDDETNRIDNYPETAEAVLDFTARLIEAFQSGQIPEPDLSQITVFNMQCRSETTPNPESRVMLSQEKDALGVPRVRMNWQLTDLDKRTLLKTFEVIGEEAGRTNMGRVQVKEWLLEEDPFGSPNSLAAGGWHHMGTTRMNDNPREGVVDANCKVHGINNLFVAGSAAFATSGAANPTLSLIALSLKLSDHLKEKMG